MRTLTGFVLAAAVVLFGEAPSAAADTVIKDCPNTGQSPWCKAREYWPPNAHARCERGGAYRQRVGQAVRYRCVPDEGRVSIPGAYDLQIVPRGRG